MAESNNSGEKLIERPGGHTLDRTYFEATSEPAPEAADPPISELRDSFSSDLDEFASEWEPYLADDVPDPEMRRPTTSLTEFAFRYEAATEEGGFDRVLEGEGSWESVTVPDYRGPVGAWTGFYRTEFEYEAPEDETRVVLQFEAVDYVGTVYLNGRCVTRHEGFFAPFEVDVTDEIETGGNVLVVEVENQVATDQGTPGMGELDGDKLFADAGMGFDDPEIGWHMNAAGAGLRGEVTIEERAPIYVASAFVRPDPDTDTAEARIEVENPNGEVRDVSLDATVYPQNFDGEPIDGGSHDLSPANLGRNDYRITIDLPDHRRWEPAHPWLYTLRVELTESGDETPLDSVDTQFGMRSFEMESEDEPKGRLYLNGDPVRLRGANCSAHLEKAAFEGDESRILEDLLIAKYANANFLRLTQRPLPDVVYEYCDKLGLLTQTDLPLSGGLRRNQFVEGVKQATEMERVIRGHPSAVLVSFVNEPQGVEERGHEHRWLDRDGFASFVTAATEAIHEENPDRTVKTASGASYPLSCALPPVSGLPDFHTYTMWYYSTHMGDLHRGELPTVLKDGWLTGCGEYGAEGLDNLETMLERYPDDWLPESPDDEWDPDVIPQCQTYGQHVLWYDEPDTLEEWVEASQTHQARATAFMTDALRRSDRVVLLATYYLIDAWPAGWLKALVDVERSPKRGYFELKRSLKPRRVNLRTDRTSFFAGETAEIEAWALNDRGDPLADAEIRVTVRTGTDEVASYASGSISVAETASRYVGSVRFEVPGVADREPVHLDAALYDDGTIIDTERLTVEAFEPTGEIGSGAYLGNEPPGFSSVMKLTEYEPGESFETLLVSDPSTYHECREHVLEEVAAGGRVIFLRTGGGVDWELDDATVSTRRYQSPIGEIEDLPEPHMVELDNSLPFVARSESDPRTAEFESDDFGFWYDATTDKIRRVANSVVDHEVTPLLYGWETESTEAETPSEVSTEKSVVPVVGATDYGEGELVFSELITAGRIGYEPVLHRLLAALLE